MKKIALAAICLAFLQSVVLAPPVTMFFQNEPDTNWPTQWSWQGTQIENPWITPSPYQRNILCDFSNSTSI